MSKRRPYLDADGLRLRALERLEKRTARATPGGVDELRRLVQELEIHEVELELQNEELSRTRLSAEQAAQSLADLYDFAPVGYATLASDGSIVSANLALASLLGLERSRLVGRPFASLVALESWATFDDFLARTLTRQDEESSVCELGLEREGGGSRHVRVTGRTLQRAERQILIVIEDITDRKRAEEELRAANLRLTEFDQRRNEFLGVLSHELRNSLAPITTSMYVLEHVLADSPQAFRARQVVGRKLGHLTQLVNDLLDVARVSRGKIQLKSTTVDLCELVLHSCEDHQALFEQASVTLHRELPSFPVWVEGDSMRLAQVLENLLQNALKFTPAGRAVSVRVSLEQDSVKLRVRDEGIGMDRGEVELLFEPFTRARQNFPQGGLGLGLALAKGLVELQGGSIEAASGGRGQGSELCVTLPAAPPPAVIGDVPVAPPPPTSPRLVLLIEDNPDTSESLSAALEQMGHRVHAVREGRSGIIAAREIRPDVVLCDIGLPDIDGYHVARELRHDDSLRATRLIALSGYAQPEDRLLAMEAGFHAHMAKPPEMAELARMIATE